MSATLVFDLDGTLSDPSLGIIRSMNYALSCHDFPPRSDAEIQARIGPPLEDTMAFFSESVDDALINRLVGSYRERYMAIGYAENRLYPDIVNTLTTLQNRQIPMGVCTSKHPLAAEKVLTEFALTGYFDFVSGTETGAPKSVQLKALLADGKITATAIMIGDRAIDLVSARSNGLRNAGVLWGFGSAEELQAQTPDFLLREPGELLSLVNA